MAKNIRRMFAMVMVLCMILSALPMQALAAESEAPALTVTETITGNEVTIEFTPTSDTSSNVSVSGTNESGSSVALTGSSNTSSSETSNSDGTKTESATTEVTLKGTETTASGIKKSVEYQDTTTESTTTDGEGNVVAEKTAVKGTETKKWTEEDTGDGEQPDVTADIKLETGGTGKGVVETTETVTNADGSVTTTTTTDRTVTTETVKVKTTVNDSDSGLVEEQETDLTGRAPVYDYIDGVKQDKGGMFDNQYNSGLTSKYAKDPEKWDMPEDADVRFVGTGEHTTYYSATVYVVYEKDAEGNTIYDEEGKPVIKELYRYDPNVYTPQLITIDGVPVTELPEGIDGLAEYDISPGANRPTLHALMDQNGNVVYGYCIDNMVDTSTGDWYKIINLEDSNYYASEDAENHVRNIVLNGYWGTTNIAKEDGTYEEGSVESIKAKILDAVEAGKLENEVKVYEYDSNGMHVRDEDGNPKYTVVSVEEVIAGLTAGEAHIATQAAIWSFSNGSIAAQNGKDGYITIDPDFKNNHKAGNSKPDADILDGMGGARLDILYTWLIGLEDPEQSTTIINEKNFIEDMNITVHEKVTKVDGETVEENFDNDTINDVYNTDLNFKLAFVPGPNDDLLVQVTYTDFDGKNQTVIRRLAGDKEDHAKVDYDEATGSYVLKGLILSENEEFNFDLRLEGTQYLENGVYVYESLRGREVAQNFVGVAEGTRNVDVSVGVTIKFEVDENNRVVAERKWDYESDPGYTPPGGGEPVPANFEDAPAPQIFRLNNQDNLVEIPEEPVPLATPAVTGDNSGLWIAVVLLSVFAMAAINLFDKKRQHEAF